MNTYIIIASLLSFGIGWLSGVLLFPLLKYKILDREYRSLKSSTGTVFCLGDRIRQWETTGRVIGFRRDRFYSKGILFISDQTRNSIWSHIDDVDLIKKATI